MAAVCPYCLSGELHLNARIGASQIQFSCRCRWPDSHQISTSPKQRRRAKAKDTLPQGGDNMGCFICQCLLTSKILEETRGNYCIVENPETSAEAHFNDCQKIKSARVPWQDSHEKQAALLGGTQPSLLFDTAKEILLVALGLLIPILFFFFFGHMLRAGPWPVMFHHSGGGLSHGYV